MPSVLIVDDDKFTRTVLETIFAQDSVFVPLAVDVYSAADGEEGLAEYRKHKPDVVIVDLLMPKLDGFGLCKALRAEDGGEDIHLVIMSGIYRDTAISQRVRSEYGAVFFAKPYQLKDMTHHIATLIGGDESARPAAKTRPPSPTPAQPSQGDIADRCMAAVLLDLVDARATGKLHLERGRITKVVDLAFGHPTNVTTSVRDELLGHFLAKRGLIDADQHSKAVEHAAQNKLRIGEALIALGALTPEQLLDQLTAQVKHKLTRTLRWPDGAWRFEPHADAPSAPVGHPIDTIALVVTGLRETAALTPMPAHLADIEGAGLRLKPRGTRLLPVLRQHLSASFAEAWVDGATIADIIARGADQAEAYLALDVIVSCDAVDAGTPDAAVAATTPTKSSAISIAALSHHAEQAGAKPSDESEEELYSTLFDEGSVIAPLPTGHDPIDLADGVPEASPNMDSGYIDVRNMNAAVAASYSPSGSSAQSANARASS
jgi:CheY-like chemotaxis protein